MKTFLCVSALLLGIFTSNALAVGLGEPTLHTHLNEPLKVTIPVLSTGELTINELKAKIADSETFAQQGLERSYIHSLLQTELQYSPSQGYMIEISSRQSFKEPWVTVLIDLRWPKGKIVKEVTLMIDKPD